MTAGQSLVRGELEFVGELFGKSKVGIVNSISAKLGADGGLAVKLRYRDGQEGWVDLGSAKWRLPWGPPFGQDLASHSLIGTRISVYWEGSRDWFDGTIHTFVQGRKKMDQGLVAMIHYDDGDKRLLDLGAYRWQVIQTQEAIEAEEMEQAEGVEGMEGMEEAEEAEGMEEAEEAEGMARVAALVDTADAFLNARESRFRFQGGGAFQAPVWRRRLGGRSAALGVGGGAAGLEGGGTGLGVGGGAAALEGRGAALAVTGGAAALEGGGAAVVSGGAAALEGGGAALAVSGGGGVGGGAAALEGGGVVSGGAAGEAPPCSSSLSSTPPAGSPLQPPAVSLEGRGDALGVGGGAIPSMDDSTGTGDDAQLGM